MSPEERGIPWGLWLAFVAGVVVCLAAAVGAYKLADYSWNQVVSYTSPYIAKPTPAGLLSSDTTPSAPVSSRVVLVIVDGLREDTSRSMPTLNALRNYGSDVTLTVPQPSLSYPNWTTILTGASQQISGVTTNWYTKREPAPTLMDVARAASDTVVVVGPTDFTTLFGVKPGPGVSLRTWPKPAEYLTSALVGDALKLSRETSPNLVVLHLPDLDEAGHTYGGGSKQYRDTAARIDADLGRLVAGLQGDGTTFIVTADHGHIDAGGHGGWEYDATHVPGVFAGTGIRVAKGSGQLQQIAPTVAALLGLNDPAYAEATALTDVLTTTDSASLDANQEHHLAFAMHFVGVVRGITPTREELSAMGGPDAAEVAAHDQRLTAERGDRLTEFLIALFCSLLVAAIVLVSSWRAFVAGVVGVIGYYGVYDALFFWVHRYQWSLSAFNTTELLKGFMYWRMGEAAAAALVGVALAVLVYPLLRSHPKGPTDGRYLPGYLSLAASTLMLVLATLAVQVAWYLWQWGAPVVWTLPDLKWGFKYDLDLVQMTAVGFAALVAPLVTYLIGRYHPKVRKHAG